MLCRRCVSSEVSQMVAVAVKQPEHLEPNPLKRERYCPVVVKTVDHIPSVTVVRKNVINAKNKTEVIKHLLDYLATQGINSDAGEEWWEKRKKLGV